MSGVLLDGKQYEHCNECGKFVEINHLFYELPTEKYTCGRDLCENCCINLGHATKEIKGKLTYLTINEELINPANFLLG